MTQPSSVSVSVSRLNDEFRGLKTSDSSRCVPVVLLKSCWFHLNEAGSSIVGCHNNLLLVLTVAGVPMMISCLLLRVFPTKVLNVHDPAVLRVGFSSYATRFPDTHSVAAGCTEFICNTCLRCCGCHLTSYLPVALSLPLDKTLLPFPL